MQRHVASRPLVGLAALDPPARLRVRADRGRVFWGIRKLVGWVQPTNRKTFSLGGLHPPYKSVQKGLKPCSRDIACCFVSGWLRAW